MNSLYFEVDRRNDDLFNARLSRLKAGCDAHELPCDIEYKGEETRELPIIKGRKQVGSYTVDFDKYYLVWEEPTSDRYAYVGVLREVGNSNILDINGEFKTKYLDNEDFDIGIPDELYHVYLECEHCMSGRTVTKTHVIFDFETDMFFQVAKGCLTGYIYFSKHSIENTKWDFSSLSVYEDEEKLDFGRSKRTTSYIRFDQLCKHSLSHFLGQDELRYISRYAVNKEKGELSSGTVVLRRIEDNTELLIESNEVYPLFLDYILSE